MSEKQINDIAAKIEALPEGNLVIESAFGYDQPKYIKGLFLHTDDLKALAASKVELERKLAMAV